MKTFHCTECWEGQGFCTAQVSEEKDLFEKCLCPADRTDDAQWFTVSQLLKEKTHEKLSDNEPNVSDLH